MEAHPRVVWMPGRVRTEIHVGGRDTAGAFCMMVDHPPPGWALPAHLHHGASETVHVLEGEFEMLIDGERFLLTAGQTAHVPPDVIHAGGNIGTGPGRRVLIFSPAGMDDFFREIGAASPEATIPPEDALAAATRYGWVFAPGPRRSDR